LPRVGLAFEPTGEHVTLAAHVAAAPVALVQIALQVGDAIQEPQGQFARTLRGLERSLLGLVVHDLLAVLLLLVVRLELCPSAHGRTSSGSIPTAALPLAVTW